MVMDLPSQNAKYIQLLNNNNVLLERNITVLEQSIKSMDEMIGSVTRNAAAMQRAMVDFLTEKGVIENDDDIKLLQKFHVRNIAKLDQEMAARKAERKEDLK
jgi:hypothetical protein